MPIWTEVVTSLNEIFTKALNTSIILSWVILVILIARLFLKDTPKNMIVKLWSFVALRLLIPSFVKSPFSLIPSTNTLQKELILSESSELNETIHINIISNPIFSNSITFDIKASTEDYTHVLMSNLALIWVIGVISILLYSYLRIMFLKRDLRNAINYANNTFRSNKIVTSFTLGLISPKIYLPLSIGEEDINYVFDHEKSHINHLDHWWKIFGFMLATLNWYNPILWIAFKAFCQDIEFACDERVIRKYTTDQKANYSQALLNSSIKNKNVSFYSLSFSSHNNVKARIENIMKNKQISAKKCIVFLTCCIVITVCFLSNPKDRLANPSEFEENEIQTQYNVQEEFWLLPEEYNYVDILVAKYNNNEIVINDILCSQLLSILKDYRAYTTDIPAFADNNTYTAYIALSFHDKNDSVFYSLALCIGVDDTENCYAVSQYSGLNYAIIDNGSQFYSEIIPLMK